LRDYRTIVAGWLTQAADLIVRPTSEIDTKSKFVDLAPTDKADEAGIYSDALKQATDNPRVFNIALTGPYGSGKSSIIKSFLKRYRPRALQISLAAFLPEAASSSGKVSRQEIERSILQQMLYGADANKLPLSRFKRIQAPGRGAIFVSLFIVLGALACWHLLQQRSQILTGSFFLPLGLSNWFNLLSVVLGGSLLWMTAHRFYVASFGVSLKSISLKDIEITPEAATEESILNRHLDEIIYFFQSTDYDLVIFEDLDRFENAEIFVTLREINSLVNANARVNRKIRFLYALRDNIFVNTDRTKFFEFIIPVIPIINSSNSIDKMLEQGTRLSLDTRLDGQFLREVSRYLSDLRLIQNLFNEYAVYVANLETDGENVLDANKLLAILIYKNVYPSDFEDLHRGKGKLAQILERHDEFVVNAEDGCKAEISHLEEGIDIAERQLPSNLQELKRIYAMALIEKLPAQTTHVGVNGQALINLPALAAHEQFDQIVEASQLSYAYQNNYPQTLNISGFQAEVDPIATYKQRKAQIEKKSNKFKDNAAKRIYEVRARMSTLRVAKFNELIRLNAAGMDDLFEGFGDNAELARFLVFEGFLDDTYYQYTSLFHSGRLSPSDNKYLIQIRAFINPDPDFQIDNPKEVIAAMRDEDFGQSYVLNVKIADCLLSEPSAYATKTEKLFEFIASNFDQSEAFLTAYYARGVALSALVAGLVKAWAGFVLAAISNPLNLKHVAHIIAHLPTTDLAALPNRYPELPGFVSANLQQILAQQIDFEPSRLKLLKIEVTDLSSIDGYPGIARLLFDENLYQLSVGNIDFILQSIFGVEEPSLHKHHYTSMLKVGNDKLIAKIEQSFADYLDQVLLQLPENTEESVPAILSVIERDELDIDSLIAFLKLQSLPIPMLGQAPSRLHAALFELGKIQASWENCLAFMASETFDPEFLTAYLNSNDIVISLSGLPISDGEQALPLRKFLIENDGLDDHAYASYVRALPKPFQKFPADLSQDKLQILIEEKKVSFSSANLAFLSEDSDTQIMFVEKNIDRYLEIESECAPDDDFREKLLDSEIPDQQKLKIITAMNLTLLAGMPSRAAKVGPILIRTGADVSEFGADAAVGIIVNSRPINVQIPLLNKFQRNLDDQQVRSILGYLPEPFSEIKPGYGTPRIKGTEANLEFVRWLEARRFISSWSQGGLFGLDDDIRINLRRK
jgi:hypothetical protein